MGMAQLVAQAGLVGGGSKFEYHRTHLWEGANNLNND